MNESVTIMAVWSAALLEGIGIAVITLSALYALGSAVTRKLKKAGNDAILQALRQSLGRGILVGLEFLIAADIIYTVAIELTFATVGVLGIVVLIRTFLSFTLELEINGQWPWQNQQSDEQAP